MSQYVTTLEEFDIMGKFQTPYLMHVKNDNISKKNVAYIVLSKKIDEILLVSPLGFRESAIIAGLSEKHIELLAKHAPQEYKEYILKTVSDNAFVSDITEIAKDMDDDLGGGATTNQQRVRNVVQYIQDNRVVFQF